MTSAIEKVLLARQDHLEHYGVLGMRWGFRKDRNAFNVASVSLTEGAPVLTYGDASPKYNLRMANVANKTRKHLLSKSGDRVIKKVNKRHANVDLTDASNKRKYLSDLELQLSILATDKVPLDLVGYVTINNDYTGTLTVYNKASYNDSLDELRELNHSDDKKFARANMTFDTDSEGFIVSIQHIDEVLEHTDNIVDDFLEHYGVLGMKWGVRKSRDGSYKSTAQALAEEKRTANTKSSAESIRKSNGNKRFSSIQVQNRKGNAEAFMYDRKKVTLKQTQNGIVVEGRKEKDVRKVLEELRKIQGDGKVEKKSTGMVEMSNEDLRATIDRLRLERDYAQLTAPPAPKPRSRPLQDFMIRTGTQVAGQVATQVGVAYLTRAAKININKVVPPTYAVDYKKLLDDKN